MSDRTSAAYRDLVSRICDEPTARDWGGPQDVPRLLQSDVVTLLETCGLDVLDELRPDLGYMTGALRLPSPDMVLGSHLFVALEFAAREVLWPDVFNERERRDEEEAAANRPRESAESRHGVASLFRRSHT